MTTVTTARKSCGAVVCTQDPTSRGNEPRLAGRQGAKDDDTVGARRAPNELLLVGPPSGKRGVDEVDDVVVAADRARRWEGVGGAGAAAAAADDGSTLSACRDVGRRMRVKRNSHTLGENSGDDPNSCARQRRTQLHIYVYIYIKYAFWRVHHAYNIPGTG